jgi:hypothetical protein
MSKCVEHPQNDSIGKCADCDKEICSLCLTTLADKVYCPSCIDKLIGQNTEETLDLNKATRKKTKGIILFWVGVAAILISVLILISIEGVLPDGAVELSISAFVGIAGFLFVLIGAILFFVGKSEVKKAKNQNIPLDSSNTRDRGQKNCRMG